MLRKKRSQIHTPTQISYMISLTLSLRIRKLNYVNKKNGSAFPWEQEFTGSGHGGLFEVMTMFSSLLKY